MAYIQDNILSHLKNNLYLKPYGNFFYNSLDIGTVHNSFLQ